MTGTLYNHQTDTNWLDQGTYNKIELWNIPNDEFITSQGISDMTYIATDVPLSFTSSPYIPSNIHDSYYILYYLEQYNEKD